MGRRRKRRKTLRRKPMKPSRYFQCPVCGSMTLTIDFKKLQGKPGFKLAIVRCGNCGLYCELEVPRVLEKVDVYNMVSDMAYNDELDKCRRANGEDEFEEAFGEDELEVEDEEYG